MDANDLNVLMHPLHSEHFLLAAQMAASTSGRSVNDLLKIYERDSARAERAAQVGAFVNGELIDCARVVRVEFEVPQVNQAPSGWYLLGVNVQSASRRRGIATQLTNWRIDWLANRAETLFYVAVPTNVASIRLHEKFGFIKAQENVTMPPDLAGLTLFSRSIA